MATKRLTLFSLGDLIVIKEIIIHLAKAMIASKMDAGDHFAPDADACAEHNGSFSLDPSVVTVLVP
jgi:hypothetical protein